MGHTREEDQPHPTEEDPFCEAGRLGTRGGRREAQKGSLECP